MQPRDSFPIPYPETGSIDIPEKKTLSKSDQTYFHIRELILSATLPPGHRVNEDELAEKLHTSRTPVREAMRRLSNDGLITIYPKRYAEVTVHSPEQARMLGLIRMSQDILSGRLAIYYGSDAEFAQLRHLADQCEAYAAAGDLCRRISADRAFHLKITEIGKNELLMQQQWQIYQRLHLLQIQYSASWDDTEQRVGHHDALIDTLSRRDEKAYVEHVRLRCQELYDLDPKIVEMCGM